MSLAAQLAAIMGEVGRVPKLGQIRSTGGGPSYNFARDTDVLDAVIPKMAEAGIVLVPEYVELLSMDPSLSGKQLVANIRSAWLVTDGTDEIRFQTFGQGADSGDKALPKAQSNARKYALFMLYHVVTGDDPDQHASDQPEPSARGERSGARQAQAGSVPSAPARTPEEQALIDELTALPGMTYTRMHLLADAVKIPKGQHANADQLREMIRIAKQPLYQPDGEVSRGTAPPPRPASTPDAGQPSGQGEAGSSVPASPDSDADAGGVPATDSATSAAASPPPGGSPPAAPTFDDVLAVTGGELIPPRIDTAEFKALSSKERASARAYWQAHPDGQESLAEALGGPSHD